MSYGAPTFVLVALLAACDGLSFDHIPFRHTEVHWGAETDRSYEQVVAPCEEALGFRFEDGATVIFYPALRNADGLYLPDQDEILLLPKPKLADTALNHELLHRHFELTTGTPDYWHRDPLWHRLALDCQVVNR